MCPESGTYYFLMGLKFGKGMVSSVLLNHWPEVQQSGLTLALQKLGRLHS